MKFTKIIIASASIAVTAFSQGLYNFSGFEETDIESPIDWALVLNVGYDDNISPVGSPDNGSAFASAYLRGNYAYSTGSTTIGAWASLGGRYFFDIPEDTSFDNFRVDSSIGFNLGHELSERITFNSRNLLSYDLEPDFETGLAGDFNIQDIFRYRTDNSIGVRWTERFGTVHGIIFGGVVTDNQNFNDLTFYNQARYRTSQNTVLTATHRFSLLENANRQTFTGGIEHDFSANTGIVVNAGYTYFDRDNGRSTNAPFLNVALRSQISERSSGTLFARYDISDVFTNLGGVVFESRSNFSAGGRYNYQVSEKLGLRTGLAYTRNSYNDSFDGVTDDTSISAVTFNLGADFRVSDNVVLNANYVHTESFAEDFDAFEFDRNRYSIGATISF